jgi:DNA-directed RNA polymerase specialized sigma24 family protein
MATDPAADPCPEDLVAVALDHHLPDEERNAALAALEPIVREVATQCSRRLIADEQVRRDLVELSFGFVQERLEQYDPAQGPLRPWLQGVLTHFGQDLRRRWLRHARRHAPLLTPEPEQSSPQRPSLEELTAVLEEGFARMREDLDRCAWPPARAVDYYAVLLAHLRLEMVASCHRAGAAQAPGEAARRAAGWLPWRAEEEVRRFRAGLPRLDELWRRLSPRLDGCYRLDLLLEALNDPPPGPPVVYSTLAQWCYRARRTARERLGLEAWAEHGFARLLHGSPLEAP